MKTEIHSGKMVLLLLLLFSPKSHTDALGVNLFSCRRRLLTDYFLFVFLSVERKPEIFFNIFTYLLHGAESFLRS